MLLITQSQGLGSNFDVDFWAGVIRFSQNRFWGGTAGGGGREPPDARHELVGRGRGPEPGLGRGGGVTLRFDRVALGKSPSLRGPRFSPL